jgi:8-oxo-dGTP diphosphatase
MAVTDPRERFDDLHVAESHETLPGDEYAAADDSEPATAGWAVFVLAFDEAGRVLLVRQPWTDDWLAPGGAHQPGESLAETAAREVAEETGVEIDPVCPHVVDDFTFEHAETGETNGWTTVLYEAAAETTTVADDPGEADEEILDVQWFDSLPPDTFNYELTAEAYDRARDSR